jgi:hypothetical protein
MKNTVHDYSNDDEDLTEDTLVKLDANTLWLVHSDLQKHARGVAALMKTGILAKADAQPQVDLLYTMSAHYKKWWERVVARKKFMRAPERAEPPTAIKRPKDFLSKAIEETLTTETAHPFDVILARLARFPVTRELLRGKMPSKSQIADALSAGSRGRNPRFIREKPGFYRNNPKYKKAKR